MLFRYARHTNDLQALKRFYTEVLDFDLLGEIENHDDYSCIFLGRKNTDWHLEFTQSKEKAAHSFDKDDLLVFYPQTKKEYEELHLKISNNNILIRTAQNPYWNVNGTLIHDPDGYGIIISPLKIENG